jgi:hypothetical protein
MAYTHKHWAERRHRWSKFTNIQDSNVMTREKFDAAFPTRRLTNWEVADLREFCEANGIDMPEIPDRTLDNFTRIVGHPPAEP